MQSVQIESLALLTFCLRMIFSENRCPLFGIMRGVTAGDRCRGLRAETDKFGQRINSAYRACAGASVGRQARRYPPRDAGIATRSRLHARATTSGQARKEKSLLRQTRTSVSRVLSQVTATALRARPGLALMKASATAAGDTMAGLDSSR